MMNYTKRTRSFCKKKTCPKKQAAPEEASVNHEFTLARIKAAKGSAGKRFHEQSKDLHKRERLAHKEEIIAMIKNCKDPKKLRELEQFVVRCATVAFILNGVKHRYTIAIRRRECVEGWEILSGTISDVKRRENIIIFPVKK